MFLLLYECQILGFFFLCKVAFILITIIIALWLLILCLLHAPKTKLSGQQRLRHTMSSARHYWPGLICAQDPKWTKSSTYCIVFCCPTARSQFLDPVRFGFPTTLITQSQNVLYKDKHINYILKFWGMTTGLIQRWGHLDRYWDCSRRYNGWYMDKKRKMRTN